MKAFFYNAFFIKIPVPWMLKVHEDHVINDVTGAAGGKVQRGTETNSLGSSHRLS